MQVTEVLERNQTEEREGALTVAEGAVPSDLRGVLLRNGPGMVRIGEDPVAFFDGLGAVAAVAFTDEGAYYRSRFTASDVYRAETAAGRMLHRRVFTNLPGRWSNLLNLRLGDPVAHDVYAWGGRVVACDTVHVALDPTTFEATGRVRWEGAPARVDQMSPMPRPDPSTGTLVAYTVAQGLKQVLSFVELDEALAVVNRRDTRIEGFTHDHAFTPSWFVVFDNPTRLSLLGALWGATPLFGNLGWLPGRAPTLHLVPRGSDDPPVRVDLPGDARTIFHVVNAYEDGESVVIDAIAYLGPVTFEAGYPPELRKAAFERTPEARLVRYTVDPAAGTAEVRVLTEVGGDTPEVDARFFGRRHRYVWMIGLPGGNDHDPNAFFLSERIVRVDTEDGAVSEWSPGEGHLVSPPVFAPRAGSEAEGDGYLLTWVTDLEAAATRVVVLDAARIENGPIATLPVGQYLPPASHCRFAPGIAIR